MKTSVFSLEIPTLRPLTYRERWMLQENWRFDFVIEPDVERQVKEFLGETKFTNFFRSLGYED